MSFKVKDYYYKKAKKENFLARSIYKLEEIDDKYKVIRKNDSIMDMGYFPGSWIQYTSKKVGADGKVIGVDIKPVNKTLMREPNVTVFEKDIFDVQELSEIGMDGKFDVIVSDMAPNTTGIRSVDQDRSLNLVEMVFYLAPKFLRHGGNIVIKVFDSNKAQMYLKEQRKLFNEFHFLKPKSTRSVSKEFFVIGKGFKAQNNA